MSSYTLGHFDNLAANRGTLLNYVACQRIAHINSEQCTVSVDLKFTARTRRQMACAMSMNLAEGDACTFAKSRMQTRPLSEAGGNLSRSVD